MTLETPLKNKKNPRRKLDCRVTITDQFSNNRTSCSVSLLLQLFFFNERMTFYPFMVTGERCGTSDAVESTTLT